MSESEQPALSGDHVLLTALSYKRTRHIYHTTRCREVKQQSPDDLRRRPRDSLSDKWRECQYCTGEFDPSSNGSSDRDCPLCGETVGSPTAHIRAEHNTGGEL